MIYLIIAVILLILFMVYAYRSTTHKKIKAFPTNWHKQLVENVSFYKKLPEGKQKEFQERIMQFLSEVYIEGVECTITDLDKILVAASAVIPVFGFPEWHYTNLSSVLIYPDHFNEDLGFEMTDDKKHIMGIVGNGQFEKQMILSQKALHQGFDNKNPQVQNTGVHEFVHLIDKMDGITDGVPERLLEHAYVIPWLKLIHKEMEAINDDKSDIRSYGGTNEAEFLAVASEYFFEQPEALKKKHPKLFRMLQLCFHTNLQKTP
ncbi:MAG TPA: M90 family metallopeptidase [Gillisia sp.]|nr:M90 family metallopeptidase [Gillisia sp.]